MKRLQQLAALCITGALRTSRTAALKNLLDPPLVDIACLLLYLRENEKNKQTAGGEYNIYIDGSKLANGIVILPSFFIIEKAAVLTSNAIYIYRQPVGIMGNEIAGPSILLTNPYSI